MGRDEDNHDRTMRKSRGGQNSKSEEDKLAIHCGRRCKSHKQTEAKAKAVSFSRTPTRIHAKKPSQQPQPQPEKTWRWVAAHLPPASLDPKAIPELTIKPATRLVLPFPLLSTFLFPVPASLVLLLLLTLTRLAEESSRLILEAS
ncbi:hypothetical protein OPV22_030490 [Ensete ventricosum]|uniref:Uncharacterized protein n=1 Tax=Ensete ventricosum TaxID=4639 RepID=A0AAV8QC65_ENSVE|nr:hypothetical protein OPV22_030490 [Ensete ventricosum]